MTPYDCGEFWEMGMGLRLEPPRSRSDRLRASSPLLELYLTSSRADSEEWNEPVFCEWLRIRMEWAADDAGGFGRRWGDEDEVVVVVVDIIGFLI